MAQILQLLVPQADDDDDDENEDVDEDDAAW